MWNWSISLQAADMHACRHFHFMSSDLFQYEVRSHSFTILCTKVYYCLFLYYFLVCPLECLFSLPVVCPQFLSLFFLSAHFVSQTENTIAAAELINKGIPRSLFIQAL